MNNKKFIEMRDCNEDIYSKEEWNDYYNIVFGIREEVSKLKINYIKAKD